MLTVANHGKGPGVRIDIGADGKARRVDLSAMRARKAANKGPKVSPEILAVDPRAARSIAESHLRREAEKRDERRKDATKRERREKMNVVPNVEPMNVKVDNPYGNRGKNGKIRQDDATQNIRESSLLAMHNRGQIDEAQYRAGGWIRQKIEKSCMSSGAIDPSHEPVDTSGHADPIPDRVIAAAQTLRPVERHITMELGRQGWLVVRLVCGEGASVAEAANRRYGLATRAQERATGQLLRDALDEAAFYLGYAQRKPVHQQRRESA